MFLFVCFVMFFVCEVFVYDVIGGQSVVLFLDWRGDGQRGFAEVSKGRKEKGSEGGEVGGLF